MTRNVEVGLAGFREYIEVVFVTNKKASKRGG